MAGLILRNLNKIYPGGQQAIRDFDLEVKNREFLILAGPEGCGKSTLLRMIAGLEEINAGTLLIDGQDMTTAEPKDRNIAMLFKNSVLYPAMNVTENLTFALRMAKCPQAEIDKRVAETAESLELSGLLEKMPEELSMVDTYRVLLGRAIMRRPGILLLDSTIADLEQDVQVQMRREFSNINKKMGITVIYVTENQETAMALGSRMVVMHDGVISQVDTPRNLYEKPANRFVAGFVGRPSMNIFPAAVSEAKDQVCLTFEGGSVALPEEKGTVLREAGAVGKEVFLGIRPDGLRMIENGKKAAEKKESKKKAEPPVPTGTLTGDFAGMEEVGKNRYVRIRVGENEYLGTADQAEEGYVTLALDASKVYVFDKTTEKTLVLSSF